MATTSNFGWPTPDDTDLVRDGAEAIRNLGSAVDASLAGTIIAVKSAIFTGVQTASVTAGGNLAVTDLTITHQVAASTNKLIISAFIGAAASNNIGGQVGIAIDDGTSLIALGNAAGTRTRVTAGGRFGIEPNTVNTANLSITFVYEPNTTDSKTYTVRAVNIRDNTRTLFINRSETDTDGQSFSRSASSLVIQEVKA
jgi:hypothetical protein